MRRGLGLATCFLFACADPADPDGGVIPRVDGNLDSGATDGGNEPRDASDPNDAGLDAGADTGAPDAGVIDSGSGPGEWAEVYTAADTTFLQRLKIASNARGDGALTFEIFNQHILASVYSVDRGSWTAATPFQLAGSKLIQPTVALSPDGAVLLVWLEILDSGASMKLRSAEYRAGVWASPNDVATLTGDVSAGITDPLLLVNASGHAAISFEQLEQGQRRNVVATRSGSSWALHPIPAAQGPARVALDDDGTLTAIWSGIGPNVRHQTFDFNGGGWSAEAPLLSTPTLYPCGASGGCYAISAGRTGPAVALLWDGVGTFSGLGTTTAMIKNAGVWTEMSSGPLTVDTTLPRALSDASGNAIALYQIGGANPLLQSRRYEQAANTWQVAESLPGMVTTEAVINGSGEVLVFGSAVGTGMTAVTTNRGGTWAPPISMEDLARCEPRTSVIALADEGTAFLAQICNAPGGGFPLFVQARRFTIR
jgi:hypothetical protein